MFALCLKIQYHTESPGIQVKNKRAPSNSRHPHVKEKHINQIEWAGLEKQKTKTTSEVISLSVNLLCD